MDESPLIEYYRKRAAQSDDTYGPPEIQKDFAWITRWLRENVAGRDVIELACGTGHWTEIAAESARSIVASDIVWDLVDAARRKIDMSVVDFVVCDAFGLPFSPKTFSCGMVHFLLSHVRRTEVRSLIDTCVRCLKPGSSLLLTDTKWIEGYRKLPFRRDEDGNTYDLRKLKDGSQFEILKNYFTRAEWEKYLASFGTVHIEELEYIWAIKIELIPQ
jgi:demethylmenaquinone methyltransferase/2-methoxy-6-polyprenyl-1,4-benzoquinol methylase